MTAKEIVIDAQPAQLHLRLTELTSFVELLERVKDHPMYEEAEFNPDEDIDNFEAEIRTIHRALLDRHTRDMKAARKKKH